MFSTLSRGAKNTVTTAFLKYIHTTILTAVWWPWCCCCWCNSFSGLTSRDLTRSREVELALCDLLRLYRRSNSFWSSFCNSIWASPPLVLSEGAAWNYKKKMLLKEWNCIEKCSGRNENRPSASTYYDIMNTYSSSSY